jgi:hypothetical protein
VRPSKKARNREYPFLILEIGVFATLSVIFAEAEQKPCSRMPSDATYYPCALTAQGFFCANILSVINQKIWSDDVSLNDTRKRVQRDTRVYFR